MPDTATFDAEQPSYIQLRNALSESARPTIVWVGSGASAAAGLPMWPDLRQRLADEALRQAGELDPPADGVFFERSEAIEREQNPWIAFQRYKLLVGNLTYQTVIKSALGPADTCAIPEIYRKVWALPIRGVLTLNLDRLATRSFSSLRPGTLLVEQPGRRISQLRSSFLERPFVGHLHGYLEEVDSWVFTHDELTSLHSNPAYTEFLRACLSMFTNIFVGMSVDDVAVGGQIAKLLAQGVRSSTNYWITSRADFFTREWAETHDVQLINYRAPGGNHAALGEVLDSLRVVTDTSTVDFDPVQPEVVPVPLHRDLSPGQMTPDDLRRYLNLRATNILAEDDDENASYTQFLHDYDEEIHRAWYTSAIPGKNQLLDYTLEAVVGEGAFGLVYRAIDKRGEPRAVKVLRTEVRRTPEMLRAFRRGVNSMKILTRHNLAGMVRFHDAAEIPAFVAMEWIDGPTLKEARESRVIADWTSVLSVALEVTHIIRSAHLLPERVLHRDLRPANVMLKDYWSSGRIEVVVLDFDLSWHKGASSQSVRLDAATGYIAPEQIAKRAGESSRSAAVDAFGLGMLVYYMCRGKDPYPGQHVYQQWVQQVHQAVSELGASEWVSLSRRLERLILAATRDQQAERWDLGRIHLELDRLNRIALGEGVTSPDLMAEEILARCARVNAYEYDESQYSYGFESPTGLRVKLSGDESSDVVTASVTWASTGIENWSHLARYMTTRSDAARSTLKGGGWRIDKYDVDRLSTHIEATARCDQLMADFPRLSQAFSKALDGLVFQTN